MESCGKLCTYLRIKILWNVLPKKLLPFKAFCKSHTMFAKKLSSQELVLKASALEGSLFYGS